jgi:hypothetical protein
LPPSSPPFYPSFVRSSADRGVGVIVVTDDVARSSVSSSPQFVSVVVIAPVDGRIDGVLVVVSVDDVARSSASSYRPIVGVVVATVRRRRCRHR